MGRERDGQSVSQQNEDSVSRQGRQGPLSVVAEQSLHSFPAPSRGQRSRTQKQFPDNLDEFDQSLTSEWLGQRYKPDKLKDKQERGGLYHTALLRMQR